MKANCLYTCRGRVQGKFNSTKKRSADSKELNALVSSYMAKVLNIKENYKVKDKDDSESYVDDENINFEKLDISTYSY